MPGRRLRRLLALALLALPCLALGSGPIAAADADRPLVLAAHLSGAVSPATAQFLKRVIADAEAEHASAVVVLLDTPGGLAESMRLMVQDILTAKTPVIVYVAPQGARAASAGVMITLAGHVAAMSPGSNIGAASPVSGGGGEIEGTMAKKVMNDMIAYVRSLAERRGRNADWAERAVRYAASLSAVEAAAEGVVDVVAPDLDSLLDWADGRRVQLEAGPAVLRTKDARIVERKPGFRDNLLGLIANPTIAYLLLMIGLAAIYFELSNPGAIVPAVVGAVSLILAFFAMQTLPVSWAGLLLIVVGVILFILELKIVSYGLLSIGGIGCLILGSVMLFDSPAAGLRLAWGTILPTVIFISAFFIFLIILVWRSQRRRPAAGPGGLIGARGQVLDWSGQRGRIFIRGEIWNAEGPAGLNPGVAVLVTGGQGLTVTVEPTAEETGTGGGDKAVNTEG